MMFDHAGLVSVPDEFKEEMQGLAEASGGKLPYDLVQRLNIGYDFVAKCTSSGQTSLEGNQVAAALSLLPPAA